MKESAVSHRLIFGANLNFVDTTGQKNANFSTHKQEFVKYGHV